MTRSDRDVTPITRADKGGERYTQRVRNLKIALPLIAIGTLALIFLIPREQVGEGLGLSPEDRAALGDGLRLVSPRFTGATEKGEPFALRAEWALPDGPSPERIDLGGIDGVIDFTDGRRVTLTAPEGQMRPRAKGLSLSGGIAIDSSDGYSVRTERAEMDGKANTLVADSPVEAWGPKGRLDAGSMRATRDEQGEDVVRFDGGVRVVFRPGAASDAAAGDGSATDPAGGGGDGHEGD